MSRPRKACPLVHVGNWQADDQGFPRSGRLCLGCGNALGWESFTYDANQHSNGHCAPRCKDCVIKDKLFPPSVTSEEQEQALMEIFDLATARVREAFLEALRRGM